MKLPSIAKLRIPILLVMAVGEVFGLLYFRGQQGFGQFVFWSLGGILLAIPLLWIESLKRSGVPGFDIFIAILSGICVILLTRLALIDWARGEEVRAQAYGMVALFIVSVILLKLLFPRHGAVGADAVTFLGFILAVSWSWSHRSSAWWIVSTALILLLFVWRFISHMRNRRKTGARIESATNQEGRA